MREFSYLKGLRGYGGGRQEVRRGVVQEEEEEKVLKYSFKKAGRRKPSDSHRYFSRSFFLFLTLLFLF